MRKKKADASNPIARAYGIKKMKEEVVSHRISIFMMEDGEDAESATVATSLPVFAMMYCLEELKEEKLMPDLPEFGIYDEESYYDLLKTIYIITPSLFVGKDKNEKKFICTTFAGLLSTQDGILIKKIIEQLQELSNDEKEDLLEILKRTTLSNIIKTIKEIDHRLDVIDKLKILISEHEKKTLEVKHLQKILDEN